MMAENINKKHEYKSGGVKVNDFIRVVLKGGDSTFPARVITVPTVVRSGKALARLESVCLHRFLMSS